MKTQKKVWFRQQRKFGEGLFLQRGPQTLSIMSTNFNNL